MICQENKLEHCCPFNPELFNGSNMPLCPDCEMREYLRQREALDLGEMPPRARGVAVLRPDITLYQEYDRGHPTISAAIEKDLRRTRIPDRVIIVGTPLRKAWSYTSTRESYRLVRHWTASSIIGRGRL